MLLTKEVEVELSSNTIFYYETLGYKIPRIYNKYWGSRVKRGTKILVKVEDLHDVSRALVDVKCDGNNCEEILNNLYWYNYKKCVHKDGKYYCRKCAMELYGSKNRVTSQLKNGKSFYHWCYDNLSKIDADKIIFRWNNELNIDKEGNILTPKDVSYGSLGFNRKGYWFNCLDHPEHKPELKSINKFTSGQKGSITCNQCNTISITHPYLIKYLVNKEDANRYSFGTHNKIPMRCPNCGCERHMSINQLVSSGFSCSKCSSGYYPEKFIFNVLDQLLDNDFSSQLSKTIFKWCDNYRYDFYLDKYNCIIEAHGLQHYEESGIRWKKSSDETQNNDFDKEWLARKNKIKNYIILDCRKSELEWIKNSIMNSRLPKLLNFKESDIDWLKCHEYACSSRVKEICDLWNSGIKNVMMLSKKLKLDQGTIRTYLKQGTKLQWCDYDSKSKKVVNI